MQRFSEKIFLTLTPPTEEDSKSIQEKILLALSEYGYSNVKMPLKVLQCLYSVCQELDYHITVTLVYREEAIQGESLRFTTIGNEKPIGICGSGIIDLIAQMRLNDKSVSHRRKKLQLAQKCPGL